MSLENYKILSFYEDMKKLKKGELVKPRIVSVWLSEVCNLNCNYCLFSETNNKGNFINSDRMYKLIDELVEMGVEGLEFSGGGEPTLHKDCFTFAEAAYTKGLKVGMFTNGTNMDFNKLKFFRYIRIGLDACNREEYLRIKGKDGFNSVISALQTMIKNENRPKKIGVKFIIDSQNFKDIQKFISLSDDLGVDYVNFRGVIKGDYALNTETLTYLNSYISELKRMYKFVKGKFYFEDLKEKCFMAPIHSVITATGNVLNCCYANNNKYVIGNIYNEYFKNIWRSERHKEVANMFGTDFCNSFTCRWREYNNIANDILSGCYDIYFI